VNRTTTNACLQYRREPAWRRVQKKKPGAGRASCEKDRACLPAILLDDVTDDAVRLVDVVDGAIAQAADGRIVFFASDIIVRLVEQFQRAMKAAPAIHVGIDRRMVFQVLAIINGGALDFPNGFVNLIDSVLFLPVLVCGVGPLAQVSARVPQVGERMQVGRMRSRFISESRGSADSDKEHEYGKKSYSFHSLLVSVCFRM